MTGLEQTLADILRAIEEAKAFGPSQTLSALLRRKEAICAVLAAPEHAWHCPDTQPVDLTAQRKAA